MRLVTAGVSGGALPVLSRVSSQQAVAFEPLCADAADLAPYVRRFPVATKRAEAGSYLMGSLAAGSRNAEAYKAANGSSSQPVVAAWAEHSQAILDEP